MKKMFKKIWANLAPLLGLSGGISFSLAGFCIGSSIGIAGSFGAISGAVPGAILGAILGGVFGYFLVIFCKKIKPVLNFLYKKIKRKLNL